MSGLEIRYPTGFVAGPLDLDVGPGVWRLAGDNGTGKTTLLRAMVGELTPTAGTVRVDGHDPVRDPRARRHVAFVPSRPELPGFLTVDEAWQTLAALRGDPDWDGADLRDTLGLPGEMLLSHGSDGQRRRAELLAGLAADPAVLLLDEPFANLDPEAAAIVAGVLDARRGDHVILVAHHGPSPLAFDGGWTLSRRAA